MLDKKQVEGLEDFSKLVVTGYSRNGNVVTLTRADGTEFSFTTYGGEGVQGSKGPTGDTGDKGPSAYQVYKRDGRTSAATETAWINSLKGETGNAGAAGTNGSKGSTGTAGVTPTFSVGTVTKLSAGSTPTASLTKSGNTYKINVGIPVGAAGTSGSAGTTPTLKMGTVSTIANNGTPTISISQSGTTYTINLGIPRGATGAAGTATGGTNGVTPTVNFEVTMGSSTNAVGRVSGNTWIITLTVPNGAKGAKGDTGNTGSSGTSTVSYVPIQTSNSYLNSPTGNRFYGLGATINGGRFFGWSQNHSSSIGGASNLRFQCVWWAANASTHAYDSGVRTGAYFRWFRVTVGGSFSSATENWYH